MKLIRNINTLCKEDAGFLLLKCVVCLLTTKLETFSEWCVYLATEIHLGWNVSVSRRFSSQIVGNRSTAVGKAMFDDPLLRAPS